MLLAAPAGMETNFWNRPGITSKPQGLLDPHWVAEQINDLYAGSYKYRFAKILRNPAQVEVVVTRD